MKRLQLLLIPLFAFIVGGVMLSHANTTAQRAAMVEPEPEQLTCDQFIVLGPPRNRHVRITDCWFADEYVYDVTDSNGDWRFVLVPIYPADAEGPCNGENVRLVARIANVRNAAELESFLDAHEDEAVGCVWDEFRGGRHFQSLLRDAYPRLVDGAYRVIFLNDDVPTDAQAQREWLTALSVIGIGVVTLAWIVWGLFRARRRDRQREWFADPRECSPTDDYAAQDYLSHLDRPAEIWTTLRTAALVVSLVSLPATIGIYIAEKFELIPLTVSGWASGLGMLVFLGSTVYYQWANRWFVEQTYEPRAIRNLPRAARRYFDRQTPPLVRQGFVHLGDISVVDSLRASVRLLASGDRMCLATLESTLWMTAYNFLSVAQDGTLLHTVSINLERKPDTRLPSRCEWTRTDDITHAYAQHRGLVAQYLKRLPAAAECLTIDPRYAIGLMDYAHRISGWSLLEHGVTRKGLPPIPRADEITREEDGRKFFAWQARPHNVMFPPDVIEAVRAARIEQGHFDAVGV